jgi:hypothetical protein
MKNPSDPQTTLHSFRSTIKKNLEGETVQITTSTSVIGEGYRSVLVNGWALIRHKDNPNKLKALKLHGQKQRTKSIKHALTNPLATFVCHHYLQADRTVVTNSTQSHLPIYFAHTVYLCCSDFSLLTQITSLTSLFPLIFKMKNARVYSEVGARFG